MVDPLSPGLAHGAFELVDLLAQQKLSLESAATLRRLGVVAAERATTIAIQLGWVEVSELGMLCLTPKGHAIQTLELSQFRLRRAILDFLEKVSPPWLQHARFGRREFMSYAPREVTQMIREAGLDLGESDDIVEFWDELGAGARGLHSAALGATGREGERNSLKYERRRTQKDPKWIAVESAREGYDILSIQGGDSSATLCIEVKASKVGMRGSMFLTRHEWESAESFENYCVHLWDLSAGHPRLAIIELMELRKNLPSDQGCGAWDVARVPFGAFSDRFEVVELE